DGRLTIDLECVEAGSLKVGSRTSVDALKPFKYDVSGAPGYPVDFAVSVDSVPQVTFRAHIWPPKSSSLNYVLDRRVAVREGFYFYRNDRLIQAGGWNGMRDPAEPHLSLARVACDLPVTLDNVVSLDVQKSSVVLPALFIERLETARADNGTTFSQFI